MHVDVSQILARETGYRASFKIQGERPDLADLELVSDLEGEIAFVGTGFGLAAEGEVRGSVRLECHRCLRAFASKVQVKLKGEFAFEPDDDQWPIHQERDKFLVDIAPLVRQELLLSQPIKVLCQDDCLGLCAVCGKRQEAQLHRHKATSNKRT